jgi:hypothetical protein
MAAKCHIVMIVIPGDLDYRYDRRVDPDFLDLFDARPAAFGGRCDLLAIDSAGRLLAVEVKPCQGTSGLPCGRSDDLPLGGQVISLRADR